MSELTPIKFVIYLFNYSFNYIFYLFILTLSIYLFIYLFECRVRQCIFEGLILFFLFACSIISIFSMFLLLSRCTLSGALYLSDLN
jgi:hypothetical protein